MIDKEVVSLLTRLIDHVESGVILSAIHPIIIDAREMVKKIKKNNRFKWSALLEEVDSNATEKS
jgi:hypothetical protein